MQSLPWRIAVASSIGTSHIANGSPCQDSYHCRLLETHSNAKVLVAVASDGAGTARCSDVGSQLACNSLGELAKNFFDNGGEVSTLDRSMVEKWIKYIVEDLSCRAADDGNQIREYACTLLAVIVSEAAAAFIQIGDGAIVVSHGVEDGWSYVFWPQHGEFANTTNFLISADVLDCLGFELALRPIKEFAVFTDGIENLVLHKASKTVHEPFFNAIFRAVRLSRVEGLDEGLSRDLANYLATPAITDRTDDDKTLILASRLEHGISDGLKS